VSDENPGHVAHHNVAVMTTEDKTMLDAMLSRPEIRPLVWKRLDDTHALVDTEHRQQLLARLRGLGYTPRFSERLPD
jgi:hypothetical protein